MKRPRISTILSMAAVVAAGIAFFAVQISPHMGVYLLMAGVTLAIASSICHEH